MFWAFRSECGGFRFEKVKSFRLGQWHRANDQLITGPARKRRRKYRVLAETTPTYGARRIIVQSNLRTHPFGNLDAWTSVRQGRTPAMRGMPRIRRTDRYS